MKNTILPKSEVELVKEAMVAVNKIIDNHSKVVPDLSCEDSVMRVHTLMYEEMMSDFLSSAKCLENLLEMDKEEFIENITENEVSVQEFENKLMMKMLMDIVTE